MFQKGVGDSLIHEQKGDKIVSEYRGSVCYDNYSWTEF
jgi:hypothetical protein